MSGRNIIRGALIGLGLTVAAMLVFWISSLLTGLPFIPFAWFEWLSRVLPGSLITTGIEGMVRIVRALNIGPTADVAKLAEQGMALGLFATAGLAAGAVASLFGRIQLTGISLGGFVAALVLFVVSGMALFSTQSTSRNAVGGSALAAWIFLLWSVAYPRFYFSGQTAPTSQETAVLMQDRRTFFRWMFAGAAGLATILIGYSPGLRRQIPVTGSSTTPTPTSLPKITPKAQGSPSESDLASRFEPAPGTRPEITAIDDFYRIDINLTVPEIDAASWKLDIKGLIENPVSMSLEDIRARPPVDQYATLSCISNYLGGDLIGTAVWTGIHVRDLLNDLKPKPEAVALYITADDGFFETVPLEEAMDERTLLVYAMNGKPLTSEHGFPLRIFIPNHYGMKQPKWIRSIEVVDRADPGYWVVRGWDHKAIPQTTSVVDTADVQMSPDGKVPIGGIAWAGARGIQKVEVQIDDGEWMPAELRQPPLSQLTWVQWRYDWQAEKGSHMVRVRAVDGEGTPQKEFFSEPHPSGATGIHSKRFMVS